MAVLAFHWLRHFQLLLWNHWTEFNKNWQKARSQRPLPSLCFSGRSEQQDGHPGLWLAETFWTSPPKPLNGVQTTKKLDRKQDLNVLYQVRVFRVNQKKQDSRLDSELLINFWFLHWNLWNQRKLTGSQISTSCTKFVFFYPIRKPRWPPIIYNIQYMIITPWHVQRKKMKLKFLRVRLLEKGWILLGSDFFGWKTSLDQTWNLKDVNLE